MQDERTRALISAGEFLHKVAYSEDTTPKLREQAVRILRHYPGGPEIRRQKRFRGFRFGSAGLPMTSMRLIGQRVRNIND
jgi:hypothetical protein